MKKNHNIAGLNIIHDDGDSTLLNMREGTARSYVKTLKEIKESGAMNVSLVLISHHGATLVSDCPENLQMGVINYE